MLHSGDERPRAALRPRTRLPLLRPAVRARRAASRHAGRALPGPAAQPCAGRPAALDAFVPRRDPPADSVRQVLGTRPGPVILPSPLRAAEGTVEDFRIEAAAPDSADIAPAERPGQDPRAGG
ncbi:hypothetical protein [Streptomyces sp. NPDC052701]|uniref:hypothetical protein n=1 Tax=Streptomyces sp. NPDC052701 TaxID=3155533 RepID=UPI00342304B6